MEKARIVFEYDVRFDGDMPAFTSEILSSNPNIEVFDVELGPFGGKFKIVPRNDEAQLVSGSLNETKNPEKRDKESFLVFGRVLHEGKESKVEKDIDEIAVKEDVIEFQSKWIHDRQTAEEIASWVASTLKKSRIQISVTVLGNPLLEVGDKITIKHTLESLNPTIKFTVTSINHSWGQGLETTIKAVQV